MSDMTVERDEAARVAEAYARRDAGAGRTLYTLQHPGTLFIMQALERILLRMLRRAGLLPVEGRRLLEVGCGTGDWLRALIRWGCRPQDLAGIDLLPERVDAARSLCPAGLDLRPGDATALPYPDASFDLVLQSTMFTSILDDGVRRRAAAEMLRVLRPGGHVIWYDFRVNNPRNPDVRRVGAAEIRALFPGCNVRLRSVTLAPPIVRRLAGVSWLLCHVLSWFPFLRTHYLGLLRKD